MENLLKIVDAVKKFLAKEFLWGLAALLLGFLLALITKWRLSVLYGKGYFKEYVTIASDGTVRINDVSFTETEYFLILCVFYIAFIYFV